MPIASVESVHLLDMCRFIETQETLETSHRALEHCSNVFRFGIAETLLKTDPCRDLRGALEKPIPKHFAAITKPRPLAELLKAIDGYHGSMIVRSAMKLMPMLFLRPGELRKATWDEIDLPNGLFFVSSMRMKRTKQQKETGDPHFVSLPRQAVDILWDLHALTGRGDFVFPAEGRFGRPMSDGTINAALRSMGYSSEIVTAHGFRTSARTLLAEALSIEPAVVELQLAHEVKDPNGNAYSHQRAFVLQPPPSEQQAGRDAFLAGHERHAHAWFISFANQGSLLGSRPAPPALVSGDDLNHFCMPSHTHSPMPISKISDGPCPEIQEAISGESSPADKGRQSMTARAGSCQLCAEYRGPQPT